VRTSMGVDHMSPGHATVRYFAWDNPDKEFASEEEAADAAERGRP